jgi:dCTP diphosphatase
MSLQDLTNYLRGFAASREWEQYHTPANLAKSASIEASELLALFQWQDAPTKDPAPEMADILIYLLYLADVMGIDLEAATWAKIAENGQRYPVDKCKGKATKYDKL